MIDAKKGDERLEMCREKIIGNGGGDAEQWWCLKKEGYDDDAKSNSKKKKGHVYFQWLHVLLFTFLPNGEPAINKRRHEDGEAKTERFGDLGEGPSNEPRLCQSSGAGAAANLTRKGSKRKS